MQDVENNLPKVFIDKVHFKGYKSIEDVRINFKKHLNILIGKNGSGKSNFLELVNQTVCSDRWDKPTLDYGAVEFVSEDEHVFKLVFEKYINEVNDSRERIKLSEKFFIDNKEAMINNEKHVRLTKPPGFNLFGLEMPYYSPLIFNHLGYDALKPFYVRFDLPHELNFIENSQSIIFNSNSKFHSIEHPDAQGFIHDIFQDLSLGKTHFSLEHFTTSDIIKRFTIPKNILFNIRRYSPIEELRFNPNLNLYQNDKGLIIDNIKLEFKINDNWLPWSQLSDGTKRLFYLISEVTYAKGLAIIEEPELGIHPHQFNLLMDFLKEQSEYKQILISTHSPKALDHLSPEELDSVLIASYDLKKGTQIKHLTPTQIKKAKKYMKEVGFFSDYWMLSDLEE